MERNYLSCGEAGDIISATGLKIRALAKDGASREEIFEVAGDLDRVGWPENVKEVFIKMWIESATESSG